MKIVHSNPNVTNWNPETGYGKEVSDNDYPRRVFNAQLNAVLYVQLKSHERDLEYLCVSVNVYNLLIAQHFEIHQILFVKVAWIDTWFQGLPKYAGWLISNVAILLTRSVLGKNQHFD